MLGCDANLGQLAGEGISMASSFLEIVEFLGEQEIFTALFVFFMGYRHQLRHRQRALATALRAEVGIIRDRIGHIFRVYGDEVKFKQRLCLHQRTNDWDSCMQIYKANLTNLERLDSDLIISLAVLYANLTRFVGIDPDQVLLPARDGKLLGEKLLRKVMVHVDGLAGSKLEWTCLPWYRRKFLFRWWHRFEMRKLANHSIDSNPST